MRAQESARKEGTRKREKRRRVGAMEAEDEGERERERSREEGRAKVCGSNKCDGKFAFAGHAALGTSREGEKRGAGSGEMEK